MSREGISIGSHTSTHRILTELSEEEVEKEISASKEKIEKILGKEVLHFAYPFGKDSSFNIRTKEAVQRYGFSSACSMLEGMNVRHSDLYALKRIGIGDCKLPTFVSRLVLNEILAIFKKA